MVSKKLFTINIIVVLLLIAVYTLRGYLIMYPMKPDFWMVVSESSPQYLFIALVLFVLIAWLISQKETEKVGKKR